MLPTLEKEAAELADEELTSLAQKIKERDELSKGRT